VGGWVLGRRLHANINVTMGMRLTLQDVPFEVVLLQHSPSCYEMGGVPLFARIGHQGTVPGFKYKTIINDISERILALICSIGFWCV